MKNRCNRCQGLVHSIIIIIAAFQKNNTLYRHCLLRNERRNGDHTHQQTMTSVGAVALGRTASLVVAVVLLFCGELRFTANAFQTTNRFGKPLSLSKPVGRATLQPLQQRPVGRKGRGDEGRFFVTLEATPANATSANGLDDESAPEESVEISDAVEASSSTTAVASETDIPSEAFFPPPKAGDSSEEKTDSTTTKGRKRRAIQRMRQQYFSRPIESRLGRTLVFPVVSACGAGLGQRYFVPLWDSFPCGKDVLLWPHLYIFSVFSYFFPAEDTDLETAVDGIRLLPGSSRGRFDRGSR